MPTASYDHPLFGKVEFTTNSNIWVRGDGITLKKTEDFDPADIAVVQVPQLATVRGANGGKLRFHKKAHAQLLQVFADLERLQLLHHIRSCAGTYNPRLRKPIGGGLSKLPSNHSFGTAIDLNSDDGSNGGTTAPLAPVFEALGFHWGMSFNDPMHYEVDEFIGNPKSVAVVLASIIKHV